MATLTPQAPTGTPGTPAPRHLLPGDRLDQETFHALYEAEPPNGPKFETASYDLHAKMQDYERAGVREYVVVVLREERVVWFARRGERFEEKAAGGDGWFRSETYPGLWLDATALLRRDTAAVIAALNQGLAEPEHSAFKQRLSD